MRARGKGHIVNISSVGGLYGGPGAGYYNSTKFALEGLSDALALEVEPCGIRVTAIESGPFRTDRAGRSVKLATNPIAAYADTAGARRVDKVELLTESDAITLHVVLSERSRGVIGASDLVKNER